MIGLLFTTDRCTDGVALVDGAFQPRSERREPVSIRTTDLSNPAVIQFLNAHDDLVPFLSRYTAGSLVPIGPQAPAFSKWNMLKFLQGDLRRHLTAAGGPNPLDALVALSHPVVDLHAVFRLEGDKPQMLLRCEDLIGFMKMETALVALEGAKLAACEHCGNLFLTGSSTSRRSHATYCSDRCRVAAMRARKKGGE